MEIQKFEVERVNSEAPVGYDVYFGERIRIVWELELNTREREKKGTEELAVIYPYGWKIKEEKGSIILPFYADMDIWMRTKNAGAKTIESKTISVRVVQGKADAELTVKLSVPACLKIKYENADYGFLSQGVGRVEEQSRMIEPKGTYEFITPYLYEDKVGYAKSNFYYS